jgi:hypothetical protein
VTFVVWVAQTRWWLKWKVRKVLMPYVGLRINERWFDEARQLVADIDRELARRRGWDV